MAMLEPKWQFLTKLILVDIDALRIVANGVKQTKRSDKKMHHSYYALSKITGSYRS
jgi:hypothetical protein